jgi:hypothetical protein
MPTRKISPLAQINRRAPEAGRIRLGIKTGKAMTSIDSFRFTSPDRSVIEQIAQLYGGQAQEWNDPSANPPKQWQVITTATEIRIMVIPDGLSQWHELWSKGGCLRRCDGAIATVPEKTGPQDFELVQVPCICREEGTAACDTKTRISVVLPDVDFTGTWRLDTKGDAAAAELPGMYDLIHAVTAPGRMVHAALVLEQRKHVSVTGTHNFVVPKLILRNTPDELAAGQATIGALGAGAPEIVTRQLNAGASVVDEALVVDAVELTPELLEVEAALAADARNYGLDESYYVDAIAGFAQHDLDRMREASRRVRAEELIPVGFAHGRVVFEDGPNKKAKDS